MNREVHTQNYFENISNVNIYGKVAKPESLSLIILTSQVQDFESIDTENIPLDRYEQDLKEWQVYQNQSIDAILKEFAEKSKITIQAYFFNHAIISANESKIIRRVKKHRHKFVFIVDTFSLLLPTNERLAKEFDQPHKKSLGACLIPICETLEEKRNFAKNLAQKIFVCLYEEWETELRQSFTHVELDIPNKIHFFRRLVNVAYYKELIKEQEIDEEDISEAIKTQYIPERDSF